MPLEGAFSSAFSSSSCIQVSSDFVLYHMESPRQIDFHHWHSLNRVDGCMHMGRLINFMDEKNAFVRFRFSGNTEEVPIHLCLPVRSLKVDNFFELNDPVLVRMQNMQKGVQCWVPGHVAGAAQIPADGCQSLNCSYAIQLFYGSRRLFKGRDIVKISPQFHDAIVNHIIDFNAKDCEKRMQTSSKKPILPRRSVPKWKKQKGESTERKGKTQRFEWPLDALGNVGDATVDPSLWRFSRLDALVATSSTDSTQHQIALQTSREKDFAQNRQSIRPTEEEEEEDAFGGENDGRGVVLARRTTLRTSSTNPPSDYVDYFADGSERIAEWDRIHRLTSSIFDAPEVDSDALLRGEDEKIVMHLPKASCRLTVSASLKKSQDSSKPQTESKCVEVTLLLENAQGSYQQTINLPIPTGGTQRSIAFSSTSRRAKETRKRDGEGGGLFHQPVNEVVQELEDLDCMLESYWQADSLAITKVATETRQSHRKADNQTVSKAQDQNGNGSRWTAKTRRVADGKRGSYCSAGVRDGGESSRTTMTRKVCEDSRLSHQQTLRPTTSTDDARMSSGCGVVGEVEVVPEAMSTFHELVGNQILSTNNCLRSDGLGLLEVAEKVVEDERESVDGRQYPHRLTLEMTFSDEDDFNDVTSMSWKGKERMAEVPFLEERLVNVEQFWIRESDERYIVTDDYEESENEDFTIFVEEGLIKKISVMKQQPICLGTSVEWVPAEDCMLQTSPMRCGEVSWNGEWCVLEPQPDMTLMSAHVSERISVLPYHGVCQIGRISSFSAFNFLVNCLIKERHLLPLVQEVTSWSGEQIVLQTMEVVECVNRLQLVLVEAFALQSSVKSSVNRFREREVSIRNQPILEPENDGSASPNAPSQPSWHRHTNERRQVGTYQPDHRARQLLGRVQSLPVLRSQIDEGSQSPEREDDLETFPPIIVQAVDKWTNGFGQLF